MIRPSEQAGNWVEAQIKDGPAGKQLPTAPEIAARFGVSAMTVFRILRRFRDEHKLVMIPGKGSFVGPLSPRPFSEPLPKKSSFELAADVLVDMIASGSLKTGQPLPSLKYLCLQFGIAPITARTAYREIQRRALVVKIGKNFFVGTTPGSAVRTGPKGHVLLLTYRPEVDFRWVFRQDALAQAYQKMERELCTYNVSLLGTTPDTIGPLIDSWKRGRDAPRGIACYCAEGSQLNVLLPTLKRMEGSARWTPPKVLLDWHSGDHRALPGWVNILSRGNISTVAARMVVRSILESNCRRVYLCIDESATTWNVVNARFTVLKLRGELIPVQGKIHFTFVIKPADDDAGFDRFMGSAPPQDDPLQPLRKYAPTTLEALRKEIVFEEQPESLIGKKREGPALWVFSTAKMAAAALEQAQRKGLRVPGDASILCLENDPEYFHLGISYCGPDWDTIGYLMAHSLLGDIPIAKTRLGFIRSAIIMMNKLTT